MIHISEMQPEILNEKMDVRRAVVRSLDVTNESRWDNFVNRSPDATFYHLSGWKSLVEGHLGHTAHYLYCESDGKIDGILPLVNVRSMAFGNALISMPFLVYGGPVADNDAALQELVVEAKQLATDLNVDYLELRNIEPLPGDWTTRSSYVTFRKPIVEDAEENLRAIPRKQRAMIRKGIDANLVAEVDEDAGRLYRSMLECKRNLGTPFFAKSWLEAIKDQFGQQAEILTVTRNGELVCSVMSFRFRDEILPYYGGGGEIARTYKGNDFMYWAVMEKAAKNGVKIFDYGRSQAGSGAYRFKKHWGFEPQPLAYQYHLVKSKTLPEHSPANPRYRMAIDTWKRLPLSVAALLGPPLARRLP
jgi:FemAB-related protein (PEP-CTERM system-associated)